MTVIYFVVIMMYLLYKLSYYYPLLDLIEDIDLYQCIWQVIRQIHPKPRIEKSYQPLGPT